MSFPENFGDLSGLEFESVFVKFPNWIEFVRSDWMDNCTGLFLDFYNFVKVKLSDKENLEKHIRRCKKWIENKNNNVSSYMQKYKE